MSKRFAHVFQEKHYCVALLPRLTLPAQLYLQIGDLYDKDPCGLELATEFWCPPEPMATPFSPYAGMNVSAAHRQRATHKQVSGDTQANTMEIHL